MTEPIILSHKLGVYPECAQDLGILSPDTLSWCHNGVKQQLNLDDVTGTSLVEDDDCAFPCLLIYAYPKVKVGLTGKKYKRVCQQYRFTCSNLAERSQWYGAINNTLAGKPLDAVVKPRRLQILINPTSGKQQAAHIFEQVRSLFEHSNLEYRVIQTQSAADTQNLVHNLNLSELDGLVIVGGDGTIHDAIAGLMSRRDHAKAIKLPLGIIPGGTGNGFCKTVLEQSQEIYDPINAAFLIIKGKLQSFDLAQVTQNNRKYHSFLSLSWGLISDVDIESEKLKFLGALRFDLYALLLMSLLRTYKGRFSFIPHADFEPPLQSTISRSGKWFVIEDDFIFLWGMNTSWAAHDMNVTPHAQLNDGAMDILVMRKGTSRLELLMALLRCGRGQHLNLPHMEYYKVQAFRLEPLTDQGILVVDGELVDYSPIEIKVIPQMAYVNC